MNNEAFPNPIHLLRYGSSEPLPEQHALQAGPLSMILENGTLKYIKYGQREWIRQIYAAVRDDNWGTVLPRFSHYAIERRENSFAVELTAEHTDGPVDFVWQGRIEGGADGTIRYEMEGTARRTFRANRIGFCVLHPMEMAGLPVEADTTEGRVDGRFPRRISPHQPFKNIVSMKMSLAPDTAFELLFEGDLFEMEDQRNWTDASFKTYCTPLALPYPRIIGQGGIVKQAVTLKAHLPDRPAAAPAFPEARAESLRVEEQAAAVLPELGLVYTSPLNEWERRRLSRLHLGHLHTRLNLSRDGWREQLRQAADEAERIGAKLEIEAIAGDRGEGLAELLRMLKDDGIRAARLLPYASSGLTTEEAMVRQARELMAQLGWQIALGGGSRLYFAELNRASLPLQQIESVHYPVNPQVHAFDNESILETLAGQAETLRSAKALAEGLPVAVGPITLLSRYREDGLPGRADPRQMSLFGAGWTLGSIRRLAQEGAYALTYGDIAGHGGIMDRHIGLFPVYYIFAEIGRLASGPAGSSAVELLEVALGDPLKTEALALRQGSRLKLLVANLRNEARAVTVRYPRGRIAQLRLLDERSAVEAMTDPEAFDSRNLSEADEPSSCLELNMLPYAICLADIDLD